MKICGKHWDKCRKAVEEAGMNSLVSKDGYEASRRFSVDEDEPFDPLIELSTYLAEQAINNGGVGVLEVDDKSLLNEGHLCPICLFEHNCKGYDTDAHLKKVTEDMASYCRNKGFLKVS